MQEKDIESKEFGAKASEVKMVIQSSLSSLIFAGGILNSVAAMMNDEKQFSAWVRTELGKSFEWVSERLIHCYLTYRDQTVPVPMVPPDALLELANPQISVETLRLMSYNGSVEIGGKRKALSDLTKRNIDDLLKKNKQLKDLLTEKDRELRSLETEISELRKRLKTCVRKEDSGQVGKLKEDLLQKEKELMALRKAMAKDPETERRHNIAVYRKDLSGVNSSEAAAYLMISANELNEAEKNSLRSSVTSHVETMEKFLKDLGIEQER